MASGNSPTIIKVGPCGGSNNDPPVTMDPTGVTRIVGITVTELDNFVNSFSVDFERNGRAENFMWGAGASAGNPYPKIVLQPSEYIIAIKGKIDRHNDRYTVVKSLSIQTNLQTYGPYGGSGGAFDFALPAINTEAIRGEIIGFHGTKGGLLDCIGVYIKVSLKTSSGAAGGNASGGNATNGTAAGGNATNGTAAGVNATNGTAAGGNATNGTAAGGNATNGTAAGGNAAGKWSDKGGSNAAGDSWW